MKFQLTSPRDRRVASLLLATLAASMLLVSCDRSRNNSGGETSGTSEEAAARLAQREIDQKVAAVQTATDEKRFDDALKLVDDLEFLDPDHPELANLRNSIEQSREAALKADLAAAAKEREARVDEWLAAAKAVVDDPAKCDDLEAISDGWHNLRRVRRDDPRFDEAPPILLGLEECRVRAAERFRQKRLLERIDERRDYARLYEQVLEKQGKSGKTDTSGEEAQTFIIRSDELDERLVQSLMKSRFSDDIAARGFLRAEFFSGGESWKFEMEPSGARPGDVRLRKLSLDRPLDFD